MTRDEFLGQLRIALQGRIPQSQVNAHLKYYETYIIEESRKGKTQEEVLAYLGNPVLLAKTITDLYGGGVSGGSAMPDKEPEPSDNKRFWHTWRGRLTMGICMAAGLALFVRFGFMLVWALAAFYLTGLLLHTVSRVFFGKK